MRELINCECCGVQGVKFKRCSRCLQASYCGAECQKADWKNHKKDCAPPVPLQDVAANVQTARAAYDWRQLFTLVDVEEKMDEADAADDWRGMLKCEGHMEELMALSEDDRDSSDILHDFCKAHRMGWQANGSKDHARSYVALEERRIPLLGKLQRFRSQGEAMCDLQPSCALSTGRAKPRPGISGRATSAPRTGSSR